MNPYSTFTERLVSTLATGLAGQGYSPLHVERGIWKPRTLPVFDRYLVWVAPPLDNPWVENRHQATRLVTFVLKADVYLLVKNYGEDSSVFGGTAPDLGVFELLGDVKTILRNTDLGGLVERTFRETEGGSKFESGASGGFATGAHEWVHRAKLTYTAQMFPFCHPE